LTGQPPAFEFLPPKPTVLQQIAKKYSSGKLRSVGAVAAGLVLLIGGLFLFQEIQLISLRSQWSGMSAKVKELQGLQDQIRQYQPWFDDSFRDLSILRQLSASFPEDGEVTAKTIEIHDGNVVTCSGNARDNESLLRMLSQLRESDDVKDLKVEQLRGKAPMQFTFEFHWGMGGNNED
jgi:Tfp pilus assembly protein PilN